MLPLCDVHRSLSPRFQEKIKAGLFSSLPVEEEDCSKQRASSRRMSSIRVWSYVAEFAGLSANKMIESDLELGVVDEVRKRLSGSRAAGQLTCNTASELVATTS